MRVPCNRSSLRGLIITISVAFMVVLFPATVAADSASTSTTTNADGSVTTTVTVTHNDGSTTTTSSTPTSGTDTQGNDYKETKTSSETKDKAGHTTKKEYQQVRDTVFDDGTSRRDSFYRVTEGGFTTYTLSWKDDSGSGEEKWRWHKVNGKDVRENWDPGKKKWVKVLDNATRIDLQKDNWTSSGRTEDGGIGTSTVALPPYAGPHSQIVINVEPNPAEGAAQGVLVLTEDQQGRQRYFRVNPDPSGKIAVVAELAKGNLRAFSLVRRIDASGHPEIASRCEINNPTHIPGTDTLAHPPGNGLRITETASSGQPGDLVRAHIAGNNPSDTRFTLDGRPLRTFGVSNNSAMIQLPQNTTLANHQLIMQSGGKRSNPVSLAVVQLTAEPVAPSQPGVVQTITVHINGLDPKQQAQMYFEIGGAARMLDGGTTATEPVVNGISRVQVRGQQAGKALLRFHLKIISSQFI